MQIAVTWHREVNHFDHLVTVHIGLTSPRAEVSLFTGSLHISSRKTIQTLWPHRLYVFAPNTTAKQERPSTYKRIIEARSHNHFLRRQNKKYYKL
jgi:hypothetical protein